MKVPLSALAAVLSLTFAGQVAAGPIAEPAAEGAYEASASALDWKANTITPVADPIYLEDPVIRTQLRPVFLVHRMDDSFITQGGEAYIYGMQINYAINERFGFILNKGGYYDVKPGVGDDFGGWANFQGGFKFALIDDIENQFIVTPGVTLEVPTGDREIFQGTGDGEWNIFVSAEKGFGDCHLLVNTSVRIPNDSSAQSSMLHYGVNLDYRVHQYFIPFVTASGFTVLNSGSAIPLDSEGYDMINFGSSQADGVTQIAVGAGFRTRFTEKCDFGFAYQVAVATPKGIMDDRFTFDFVFRF